MSSPICAYGESSSDIDLVTHCMLNYESLCLKAAEGTVEGVPSFVRDESSSSKVLSIRTKYYTADLEISLNSLADESGGNLTEGCECCILVLSSVEENVSSKVASIGLQALEANVDIKLLVVLKDADNATSVDNFRGERIMWTLDHSFEYIEIEKASPVVGYDEREKDGLPRLMEALHTNMWTTMERLDPNAQKSASETESSSVPETIFSMPLLPQKKDTSNTSSSAPSSVSVGDGKETSGNSNSGDEEKIDLTYKGLLDDVDEDDKVWDNFTNTLEAAKQLREQAVEGNLSDDVRRRRAADLAMQMCAMMDMGEDDSDEDSD